MPRIAKERKRAAVSINQIDRPKNLGLECLAFMYRKKRREKAKKRRLANGSFTCTGLKDLQKRPVSRVSPHQTVRGRNSVELRGHLGP